MNAPILTLLTLLAGLGGPGGITSKPSSAHCLEFVAASPEGGWVQVRNTCRKPMRGRVGVDFGYCDFDVGCFGGEPRSITPGGCAVLVISSGDAVIGELCALGMQVQIDGDPGNVLLIGDEDVCIDGFSVGDIDAPEPWPGEAVYLVDGVWERAVDEGPIDCG